MEIDIRNDDKPTVIRVADRNNNYPIVELISNGPIYNRVRLKDADVADNHLSIDGKGHAENVIKGLQKAIELGWLR